MDIGKPERVYSVEPVENPVLQTRPAERVEPPESKPATAPDPTKVPAVHEVPAPDYVEPTEIWARPRALPTRDLEVQSV